MNYYPTHRPPTLSEYAMAKKELKIKRYQNTVRVMI